MAQLHRTYIGGLERGERNPTLLTLVKLANALGISMAELTELSTLLPREELRRLGRTETCSDPFFTTCWYSFRSGRKV